MSRSIGRVNNLIGNPLISEGVILGSRKKNVVIIYLHEIVKLSYHSKHELRQRYIPPEPKENNTKEMVRHYEKDNNKIFKRRINYQD